MPNMADITVKKYDGTTDIVYVAKTPSAGDSTPARWRVDAIGSVPGNRPVLTLSAKMAGSGGARILNGKLVFPETFTDSTTGLVSVRSSVSLSFTGIVPQSLTDSTIQEASAQFANLLKSALIQSSLISGYAPS